MANLEETRASVLETAKKLAATGLLAATGGNVSARIDGEDLVAVTPSSLDYTEMTPGDVCICDFNRKLVEGSRNPSVETGMHIAVYKARPDVSAVIHTHQPNLSAFSLIQTHIPALFDEQVANLGQDVAVVPYGLSGSSELLNNIAIAVENKCNAYILQNHGALVLSANLEQAARNAKILEKTAQVYFMALLSGKKISELPAQSIELLTMLLEGKQKAEIMRQKKLREAKAAE